MHRHKGGCTCQRKCVERVAPIFGNGLMTNAFQTCKANFSAGTPAGLPNLLRKDADKTPASSPPKRDGAANLLRLPAFESIITSWNLSFGRSVYTTCTLNPSHNGALDGGGAHRSHLR